VRSPFRKVQYLFARWTLNRDSKVTLPLIYITFSQYGSTVAALGRGEFVVAWMDTRYFGATGSNVFGQRFNADGSRAGTEFAIPANTAGAPIIPAIASLATGEFVATWTALDKDLQSDDVIAQRFDASGKKGSEFQVNTYTTHNQRHSDVDGQANGSFVVVWHSVGQDGDAEGVFGQRFDTAGERVGSEFQVNQYTTGVQERPVVAIAPDDSFVVVWTSVRQDGSSRGVFGRRYESSGEPDGSEFQINTYTTGFQGGRLGNGVDVTIDD
jgi:hypothetical protein